MTPTVEAIDAHLRSLEAARARAQRAAEDARALIDGLSASLHMEAVRFAAQLLPAAEAARLDALAEVLGDPKLASGAYAARLEARRHALAAEQTSVSAEQLKAAEDGRRHVEGVVAEARAAVLQLERDPDVQATLPAPARKGGLAGVLSALAGKADKPRAPSARAQALIKELASRRKELADLEEDGRLAAAEVAQMRRRRARASDATAALAALPHEALTAARGEIAGHIAQATTAVLNPLRARVPSAVSARSLLLARAKHRYAGAAAHALVETPFLELTEVIADAARWRAGLVDGGLSVPEDDFVAARVAEVTGRADDATARFARIAARLVAFEDGSVDDRADDPADEPLWWDVIFGDADKGDFLEEVRRARASSSSLSSSSSSSSSSLAAPSPIAFPTPGPMEPPDFDTGRWLDKFYLDPPSLAELDAPPTLRAGGVDATERDRGWSRSHETVVEDRARDLGPYRLVRRLGAGGMAEVHLAHRTSDASAVVVKLIQPTFKTDPQFIALFEREGRIGMELRHDNIVRTFGVEQVQGERILTMEFVDGLSAQRLCTALWNRGSALTVAEAALIARDAARGLQYAHALKIGSEEGVIHRDISPDNLLVDTRGTTKLADFGIARGGNDATLTRSGELKGKLPFMAPELFEGAAATPAADIFALGVCLYWFLTSKRPFHGPNEGATIRAIMTSQPPPPGMHAELPADLDLLVLEMLAKNPHDRPTAATVERVLEPLCGGAAASLGEHVRMLREA